MVLGIAFLFKGTSIILMGDRRIHILFNLLPEKRVIILNFQVILMEESVQSAYRSLNVHLIGDYYRISS